ncbi:DUF805 domain-containing protein [Ilumatobacter sp.]|uniref:DUF805 domain-containing protein n=1 Tax=Ilumatobacter sp. TaxID=1967498 RepID=UPI003C505C98
MESFLAAYKNALNRYADFSGRTSVGGFWRFVAVNFVISVLIGILAQIAGIFGVLQIVYGLALLIPGIAISVRRLHDTGKSGWFLLIGLIPFIGWIIMIVFFVQPSVGPNEHGAAAED